MPRPCASSMPGARGEHGYTVYPTGRAWLEPLFAAGAVGGGADLALDQAHKWWMLAVYRIEEKGRVVVTPFLDLVFVKNKGISYRSVRPGEPTGQIMLAASRPRRASGCGSGSRAPAPAG